MMTPLVAMYPRFGVVAMAASAGGLQALTEVLSRLPSDFGAPIVLVQHLDPKHRSMLAEILGRRTSLAVRQAADGDQISAGGVWIAPPAHHMLVNGEGVVLLTETERVHFVRPSADLMFESIATSYRERSIAVVLTGTGVDGEMGVRAVKQMGGLVIAQDEATSEYFGMPGAAIKAGVVDRVLPLLEIAPALIALVMSGAAR